MREITEEEIVAVRGGSSFGGGLLAIAGAYQTGKWVGNQINESFKNATGKTIGTISTIKLTNEWLTGAW